jgi:ectoine hydroxylase-related dioxygenase (phytanoyl-CoA dioxygenase family)
MSIAEAVSPSTRTQRWNIEALVGELKQSGVVILENVLSQRECDDYRVALDRQLAERRATGSYCGNETNQVLDNYFMTDPKLIDLLYQDVTDQVMRQMIDNDYVLVSPSARNRRLVPDSFGKKTSGMGWHTDARYIGGKGIRPSLCYMSILCIDEFGRDNGATHYVPGSHLRYERPADRNAKLDYEYMLVPRGGMAIFDTALWHRVGDPTAQSRWGVFNTYGPWFMKPYHRFNEMFSAEQLAAFSPIIRQLLHCDSLPPRDHDESMITLRRVREQVGN